MMALLDTSHDLNVCAEELGVPVGQLFSPLNGFLPRPEMDVCAFDNSGFKKFNRKAFEAKLDRLVHVRHLCKFVASPDIVASARRTLELFDYWYPRLCQWPLAIVAQDGQEDLPIPWDLIKAVFIGGSTQWKMSKHAGDIIKTGKAMDKWIHVGRVNTPERWTHFEELGADSVDGTGIARYSHMRIAIRDRKVSAQNGLFTDKQIAPSETEGLQQVVNVDSGSERPCA